MKWPYLIFFRQIGATRKQSCAYHPVHKMASSFEKDFCGGEFWNSNKTWNTDSPDFTPWSDFFYKIDSNHLTQIVSPDSG
jgi:hypothetical protein